MNIAGGTTKWARTAAKRPGILLSGIIVALAFGEVRHWFSWIAPLLWLAWVNALAIYFEYKGRK